MPIKSPMKMQWFHILLALAEEDLHGFAIQRAVMDLTGGEIRLWPAMLYRSLSTLADEGLIEAAGAPDGLLPDERRRYYSITPRGRKRLELEAGLLSRWAEAAHGALERR